MITAQSKCDTWNTIHSIGTKVVIRLGFGEARGKTVSTALVVDNLAMISVQANGYAVKRILLSRVRAS